MIIINIFLPIIVIVFVAYILYFFYLQIKISQEKLKNLKHKNNDFYNDDSNHNNLGK